MPAKTTVRVALINNAAKDDSFTGDSLAWLDEDGSLQGSLNVLGNDPGSATLFSVSDTLPSGTGTMVAQAADTFTVVHDGVTYTGHLTINADGTVGFDLSSMQGKIDSLAEGQTIVMEFYYTAKMANGVLSTAKVTVEITGANDAPIVAIADQSVNEDTPWTFTLPDGAVNDPEGDPVTLSATLADGSDLPSWLSFDADTGTFSGTPPQDFNGSIDIKVTASDGSLSGSDTFTLTINPVNDAPELTGAQATLANGTEDIAYVVSAADLLAGFSDVEGDTLSVTGLTADHGTVTANPDGTFTITLDADYNGPVELTYDVSDGPDSTPATQSFTVTPVNDAPTTSAVTLTAIAEDSGARLITQAQLLTNAADVDGPALSATGLAIASGLGSLVDNLDGTWSYTPALNDDTAVSFTYTVTDGSLTAPGSATLDITPVNDAPTTSAVTLTAIAEDSGARLITQAQLLTNAADVDGPALSATGLAIASGLGSLVDNGNGTWSYTPALNDDTAVSFTYTVTDGSLTAPGSATLDITPVNDAPTTSAVTLTAIAEDSGARLITQAQLLTNAADVDGPALSATGLAIASGLGSLVDNGNGTWSYTPALNDDTAVSFTYTVTDGSLTAPGSATLDITPVNDAPTTSAVTLTAIAEDSGARLITQAQLLTNAADVDGPALSATGLAIASGLGSLVDNLDGTWSYTPALNDDTAVSFTYTVTDGSLTAPGSATLDITPVNDAPTTSAVTLTAIAEDSGARLITQAQLLTNAADVDGPALSATGLAIASGLGSLVDNGNGTWSYTPALNDDTAVSFTYTVTDGSLTAPGSATLDITPVNDAPTTSAVTLTAIAEDSGARLITQAQLLTNAADVDGPALSATGLAIASGLGSLVDNLDGTWSYTPALNDDTAVSFTYTVTDGSLTAPGSATLDITPVNDAPTTSAVTLTAIAEDSGARLITQAQLLTNAADVDGPALSATGLAIASGLGSLVDNLDGTWSYTPALNDDTAVSFTYTVTDGSLTAPGSATLDITPVNDAPTTSAVTLTAIAEDSGARLITQAQLLTNAADVDGPALSATGLAIASGLGSLVDNLDGTWSYTPALNDDTAVSFTYTVTDGSLTAPGSATLDITPVNDAPTTSAVTLTAIAEDSGARLITQAQLLTNAADVDGPALSATGLAIASGLGSLVDNLDGTWSYTPALNDDTAVSFTYTVTDGSLTAPGSATLDITPVNDAPTTSAVTLTAIAEDSGARLITQAQLLTNAADVDGPALSATGLAIASGLGSLVDNLDGTWSYTPALNDDTAVSFTYTVTDGSLTAPGSATLDITPVNDAPTTSAVTLTAIAEDSGARLITQAQLLTNAADVDGPALSATGLAIASGLGSLVDNLDGTWSYTPALNDDTAVSFTYTVTDGSLTAPGSATLDITPVNDAPPLPAAVAATTTGDPNDFDSLGNPLGQGPAGFGSGAGETIYGGAGNDTINGGNGNDIIYGGSGNDGINGNNDVDQLFGGSGEDLLQGSNASDTLIGGWSADYLAGGGSSDTFVFLSADDRGDYIHDFTAGEKIDVSALATTHFSAGAEAFGLWHYGSGSTTVQGTTYNGEVYAADTDGDASTIEFWFVMNSATPALGASDFLF